MQGLIARKIDQTQRFLEDGTRIPVTVLDVRDNTVVHVKTQEKDRYSALQLGFGSRKNSTKAQIGHAKKANLDKAPLRLQEMRIPDTETTFNIGDTIKAVDTFKPGDIIQVTGFSKGKGFQGGVKRHGFKGGPRTHGQSDRERAPGSIGQTTTPGRVYKGKRMAGRMGSDRVTVTNLQVVEVDDATKTLLVKGLVPGFTGSYVTVLKTGELSDKKFVPLLTPLRQGSEGQADKKVEESVSEEPAVEAAPEVAVEEPKTADSADSSVELKPAPAESSSEAMEEAQVDESLDAKTEEIAAPQEESKNEESSNETERKESSSAEATDDEKAK